jgi:hypothetical protein
MVNRQSIAVKKQFLLLLAVSTVLSIPLSAALQTGDAAPAFVLKDTTGAEHSLADFSGEYVILEWTNHKCPFVVKHYRGGHMQALQKEMVDDGAIWLQIVSSAEGKYGYLTAEEGEVLRKKKSMHSTAMLLDSSGTVGRAYGARVTPQMYLISPEGDLLYQGAIDSIKSTRPADIDQAENYLKSAYTRAKAGKPIARPTTVPYGCGVKY